jgi:hypothetical protein
MSRGSITIEKRKYEKLRIEEAEEKRNPMSRGCRGFEEERWPKRGSDPY